jgi:micrococcal nuclease
MWTYRARPIRVVDGDTIDVDIDVGFRITMRHRLRLLGVNTPEPRGATRDAGRAATEFVLDWMDAAAEIDDEWPVTVTTIEADSFGRWLADVRNREDESLSHRLLDSGHAVPYRA